MNNSFMNMKIRNRIGRASMLTRLAWYIRKA
jgi:hypothetical protein